MIGSVVCKPQFSTEIVCLFVCLEFFVHSRIFHLFGGVSIAGEGRLLIYDRHLLPLCSEVSLACHTSCDTGHPFMMVISEYPSHSHLIPSVYNGVST